MENKKKCVFAGTFDPLTLGHEQAIKDCLQMFDEVVVAMLVNPQKQPLFSIEQRKQMIELAFPKESKIKVVTFEGTIADLLQREQTNVYVRGIRNTVDFEYENANFFASRKLNADMVAVYLPCRQEYLHISSSMVRNSLLFQTSIDEYVSESVKAYIYSVYPNGKYKI